jgi:UDP-N-acetylmuramoyl-tripeptide--D-alanyl-D-alanine ligase
MSSEVAVARWTAGELARLVGADLEGEGGVGFDAVTTDSRESRPGAAFFALDGTRVRGMQFAGVAFGSGCPVVVVPADWTGDVPEGRAAVRCADPLAALAGLAVAVRRTWKCPVLAVTGSNGKTTVKEMTAHVLGGDRSVLRSPGNLNTVVGLARTVADVAAPPDLAVLEVGASLPGEIARLAEMVRPTGACVTNVAPAHLEGFGSLRAVAREKLSLLRAVPPGGVRVIDGDDPGLAAEVADLEVLRCGLGEGNDLRALDLRPDDAGTSFRIEDGPEVRLPVPGPHHVRNALLALALGRAHGVPLARGAERLGSFAGVPGRMSPFEAGGVLVVDDAYNANPASMRAALDWFGGLRRPGRRALVLGDMLELGPGSPEFHREIGGRVLDTDPALVVLVGEEMRAGFEEASRRSPNDPRLRHVADSNEAARLLADWVVPGDAVLVKGSRGVRMERVVQALRERGDAHAV